MKKSFTVIKRRGCQALLWLGLYCGSHHAFVQADATSPHHVSQQVVADLRAAGITQVQPCFRGATQSYSQFIEQMVQRNADKPFYVRWSLRWGFDEAQFNHYQQTLICQSFVYEVAGVPVRGYLVAPKGGAARKPVLLYNRGGNGGFGSLNFTTALQQLMPLASQGYLVLASNYRGEHNWSVARRAELASAIGADEFGGADVADVVALAELAKKISGADAQQLILYGVSRGGMMALLAARQLPQTKAVILKSALTDLVAQRIERPEMERVFKARIPGFSTMPDQVLRQRSAQYWPELLPATLPVLQLHGAKDDRVGVAQAHAFAKAMQQHPRYQLTIYPAGDHFLRSEQAAVDVDIRQFLQRVDPRLAPDQASKPSQAAQSSAQ